VVAPEVEPVASKVIVATRKRCECRPVSWGHCGQGRIGNGEGNDSVGYTGTGGSNTVAETVVGVAEETVVTAAPDESVRDKVKPDKVVVVTVPPVVPLVDPEVVVDVVVVPFAPQPLKVSTAVLTIRLKSRHKILFDRTHH